MQGKPSIETQDASPAAAGPTASFDFQPQTRVVFGAGSVDKLGELAAEIGGSRVLLVTDKGVEDAGHGQHGVDSLAAAGLEVIVFDDLRPNPTTSAVLPRRS